MPIVAGAGLSYSPLLYRSRDAWPQVAQLLRGDAIQPRRAADEDAALLDGYAARIADALGTLDRHIASAALDALILITADRGSQFDVANVPQLHLLSGGEAWGDPALTALGEAPRRTSFACEGPVAALLLEELVRAGFDVAEGKDVFAPQGDPAQGVTPAAVEAIARLAGGLPIIPISINCHVAPLIPGKRLLRFGEALAAAAALTDKRVGLLVSGGLSGEPGGAMAGWIDDIFDRWLLARIERGQAADIARAWALPSRNLLAGTAEARLWMTAAAAFERAGCRARVHDYLAVHHAAAGLGFVTWEDGTCR
ncbi:hypothetical protein [Sphingomonas profundi]|uniref:DODA-type extradiol aromatic ring-opening family dioxygenase n=1 Tax=Alterirhizorhabdus profundi TaxID=2681549 RepID=UPI0018D08071|nr:hypothetical protein [Sphingomonas profundi]